MRPHRDTWSTACRTRSSAMSDAVSGVVHGKEEVGERRTDVARSKFDLLDEER